MIRTLTERHLLPMPTPATGLRRIGGIDSYQLSASLFRFTRELVEECRPRHIADRFCQTMVMNHSVHIQVFYTDNAKLVGNLSAVLMGKVFAPPCNALIHSGNSLMMFASLWRSFGQFTVLALDFGKRLFLRLKEAGIANLLPVRKRSKGFQTNVNTHSVGVLWQTLWFYFTGETSVPFAGRAPADSAGFRDARQVSVKNDLDAANLGENDLFIRDLTATRDLRECNAVVASAPLEARVARFFASLTAPKECFKSQIDTYGYILQNLRVHTTQGGSFLFQYRVCADLPITRQSLAGLSVSVTTLFQQVIIQPATLFKNSVKAFLLLLRWINSILKHFMHSPIICINSTVVKENYVLQ